MHTQRGCLRDALNHINWEQTLIPGSNFVELCIVLPVSYTSFDFVGTEMWVDKLKWQGLKGYKNAARKQLRRQGSSEPWGFLKQYKNFKFFWVLEAGHMVRF